MRSKEENGASKGGICRSRDRGETWQWAMGRGLNTETKKADGWAYGSIAQYHQLLATDAKPFTVYALNTSAGFHPPHHETVYRSDDGGKTWQRIGREGPRIFGGYFHPKQDRWIHMTLSGGKSAGKVTGACCRVVARSWFGLDFGSEVACSGANARIAPCLREHSMLKG